MRFMMLRLEAAGALCRRARTGKMGQQTPQARGSTGAPGTAVFLRASTPSKASRRLTPTHFSTRKAALSAQVATSAPHLPPLPYTPCLCALYPPTAGCCEPVSAVGGTWRLSQASAVRAGGANMCCGARKTRHASVTLAGVTLASCCWTTAGRYMSQK